MDLIVAACQSNYGSALLEGASPAIAYNYARLAADGRPVSGRDANGNQIESTEGGASSRYNFQMAGGGGDRYGFEGALNDRLIARGASPAVGSRLFVPHWQGGTDSAEWAQNVSVSPDPDTASAIIQILRHKLRYALRMTAARMAAIIIYQGESNATGTVGAGPAEWGDHWTTICDNLLTVVSDHGVSWLHPTLRFIVMQLPATNPNVATFPDWDAQRTAIADWAAVRPDAVLLQAEDGPYNTGETHHTAYGATATEGTRGNGTLIADALVDQFGIAA